VGFSFRFSHAPVAGQSTFMQCSAVPPLSDRNDEGHPPGGPDYLYETAGLLSWADDSGLFESIGCNRLNAGDSDCYRPTEVFAS
jgi:hypothetical protein